MKKLLGIVAIFLLIAGCSKKVDQAIEKCADFQTVMGSKTFLKAEFKKTLNNPEYAEIIKLINDQKRIQDETNAKFPTEMKKWKQKNPQPRRPTYEDVQAGYTFQKYDQLWNEWKDEDTKKMNELLAPWRQAKKRIEELEKLKILVIRKIVGLDLKKMTLKEKSLIKNYNKNYEKCEKAQKEAPKSFMLEWSK